VAIDEDVKGELRRYEIVEWCYDGLNGKIIPWTLKNGGTSHDPSVQAFVLHNDGAVIARAPDAKVYQASSFHKWLAEQADRYEKTYPPTRVPLLRADVVRDGDELSCPALEEERTAEKPVLLYFGRGEREGQSKSHRKEVKAARKLEKGALDSRKAAEAAEGWALLRFDLGDADAAAWAASLGVDRAPAVLLWLPRQETPELLPARLTGASLAYALKKWKPKESAPSK
jgi:hypothetical protein